MATQKKTSSHRPSSTQSELTLSSSVLKNSRPVCIKSSSEGKIRICFIIASITTEQAGSEGQLLKKIRDLDRRLYEPFLVVLQRTAWADKFNDPLVPITILGFQSFLNPIKWKYIGRLVRLLGLFHAQIVELHFPDANFAGALAARLAGVPVVLNCHRAMVDHYDRKSLILCKLGNYFVTHHVANSKAVADVAARVLGLERSKIDVIHNGVDVDTYQQESTATTAPEFQRAASRGRIVILVANLTPIKNISMFITAARMVCKRFDGVSFAVLGCGPEEEFLRRLATNLAIEDRVILAGSVKDVKSYLQQSTIGCLTSNSEGFSNSVLEYMAAGLPVVATRVGGADEAVVDGVTGYLVERSQPQQLADCLSRLLSDPELCSAMGNAGLQRAQKHFSFEAQIQAHQRLYQRLASSFPVHSAKV